MPPSTGRLEKPIIILGAARSGTTILSRVFEVHPDIAFWIEPRPVWLSGNSNLGHDELKPEHATARVRKRIEDTFVRYMMEAGRTRFAEKTPSNCLRLPFVRTVFPDCKVIHIIRDGHDAVRSMLLQNTKPPKKGRFAKRLRETPLRDLPGYLPLILETVRRTRLFGTQTVYWGPRQANWKTLREKPPHVRAALQWKACVENALRDGRALPAEDYLEFKYEDFVTSPIEWLDRMTEFVEVAPSEEMVAYIRGRIDPNLPRKRHKALDPQIDRDISQEIASLREELGYPPRQASGR